MSKKHFNSYLTKKYGDKQEEVKPEVKTNNVDVNKKINIAAMKLRKQSNISKNESMCSLNNITIKSNENFNHFNTTRGSGKADSHLNHSLNIDTNLSIILEFNE